MKPTFLPAALFAIAVGFALPAIAQNVDLAQVGQGFKKENLLTLHGGISANGIFATGLNGDAGRLPFTYYLNGGISARIANLVDVPLSFSVTNAGKGFQYPTLPTRLALHPTYKWATAHLGDISMVFSPYTLNGHQFTGAGIDLQPGRWQVSAMAGRLLRAQNWDSTNLSSPAAYSRMGWGAKVGWAGERLRASYIVFGANDDPGSIAIVPPDSLGIRPQQNLVMSGTLSYRLAKGLYANVEYASSGLTTNTRDDAPVAEGGSFSPVNPFLKRRASSEYHNALRGGLNWAFGKTVLGAGYERVDPGYRTLGAYYFNNDLESFTLNWSQQAVQNKLSLSATGGYQHDNLRSTKGATNHRTVGAVTAAFLPNERTSLTASYSNFLTYINIQSQFRRINQVNPYEYIDTLDFSQVSQNAMLNGSFVLHRDALRSHGLNANLNFLSAHDRTGEVLTAGGASSFYNAAVSYSLQFLPQHIGLSAGINASRNTIGLNNFTTLGPIASVNGRFFNQKLQAGLSLSYNATTGSGALASRVFNSRLSAGYILRNKHRLSLMLIGQQRQATLQSTNTWVMTTGYDFTF